MDTVDKVQCSKENSITVQWKVFFATCLLPSEPGTLLAGFHVSQVAL